MKKKRPPRHCLLGSNFVRKLELERNAVARCNSLQIPCLSKNNGGKNRRYIHVDTYDTGGRKPLLKALFLRRGGDPIREFRVGAIEPRGLIRRRLVSSS